MERFKEQCRLLLRDDDSENEEEEEEPTNNQDRPCEDIGYEGALDIVSAYKALKQAVTKASTIHGPGTSSLNSKNYLRMTIAAT